MPACPTCDAQLDQVGAGLWCPFCSCETTPAPRPWTLERAIGRTLKKWDEKTPACSSCAGLQFALESANRRARDHATDAERERIRADGLQAENQRQRDRLQQLELQLAAMRRTQPPAAAELQAAIDKPAPPNTQQNATQEATDPYDPVARFRKIEVD